MMATAQDCLLCSRCPNMLTVTEETFFEAAAEWTIRFEAGRIAEVFCEQCRARAEGRSLCRSYAVDDAFQGMEP
ncbi:hypothetical protein [Microbacterium azadirachtae]|uniref:Uncharacterized protein n=1 Tax=Microbacterium azadirachtae TaxID=582680 RepID=A0A0F0LVJ8_9MICO|nr:hypothetical protein [Microbacterium azadirachtae]KJL35461.1 hypothetical protein RS86_00457 [Microbacterium azadirachtae]